MDVKPYPDDPRYAVTADGDVYSPLGKLLAKQLSSESGGRGKKRHTRYYQVCLIGPGRKRRLKLVHVMVCETFHGPRPPGRQAAHLNGDCHDNRAENLVWATPRENQRDHRIAQGSTSPFIPYKLTDDQVAEMRALRAQGVKVVELAERFGIALSGVMWHTRGVVNDRVHGRGFSDAEVAKMRELSAAGWGCLRITRALKRARKDVHEFLRTHGFPLGKTGRPRKLTAANDNGARDVAAA